MDPLAIITDILERGAQLDRRAGELVKEVELFDEILNNSNNEFLKLAVKTELKLRAVEQVVILKKANMLNVELIHLILFNAPAVGVIN